MDDSVSDTPRGRFPKTAHLLKHSDFQRVYKSGRRHFSGNMTVFYLRTQPEVAPEPNEAGAAEELCAQPKGRVRVGFTVSKALGGSVERNRMRRRMLKNVIELRHAGWLYLTDLSAPDPKHIIPIATVLLMVGLQRM